MTYCHLIETETMNVLLDLCANPDTDNPALAVNISIRMGRNPLPEFTPTIKKQHAGNISCPRM
jgi:hypothetical protein